jgi:DNA-directed RNA polymerase beta subunit
MINFDTLKQYVQKTNSIKFNQKPNEPFMIVYLSENSSLINDYPSLGVRPVDCRNVVIPVTKIPRTIIKPEDRQMYKTFGLMSFSSSQKVPAGRNFFYDLSKYLKAIDDTYKVTNYRQRAGFLITNMLLKVFTAYPTNYRKVLMYSINVKNDLSVIMDRKIFPILRQLKEGEIQFDHMILTLIGNKSVHRIMIKDRNYNVSRILQLMRSIKAIDIEEEVESESQEASKTILDVIADDISSGNSDAITQAIIDLLNKDSKIKQQVLDGELSKDELRKIAITSILARSSGDITKSRNIVKNLRGSNIKKGLKAVDKAYADELLKPEKTKALSEEIMIQLIDAPKSVGNKSPEHIFKKRQIDFEKNLKNDFKNSFKVLSTKEVPLKTKHLSIIDKPPRAGELIPSDKQELQVTLIGEDGREHEVNIDIPKISQTDGTFRVNGEKKCLINQIVQCPIQFPKPFESKFESSYSTFRLYSKRTIRLKYLEIFIGGYKIPLSILLFFSFGFEKIIKDYKIKYNISETKPDKKEENVFSIGKGQYIRFENVDTELKEEFVSSFAYAKLGDYDIRDEFGTYEYFRTYILNMTGRIQSEYNINQMLENIVDPVVIQVLKNQQLPTDLKEIMFYMANKVIEGYSIDRNDISNQRIRGSEAIVHLAQKQILASYTEFKEQTVAGNENAEFKMNREKTFRDFLQLEIVANMEYANPIEEMSTMTRVTPVGKAIGGIPDKQAIQTKARNVHDSFFGNIDPLDTPEGPNIGIVQQLTIDAYITSARGLIHSKGIKDNEGSGMLSTTTSLTPFIENNDGARVIMLSAQQKQAVPLKNPEPPIVQSGYESILTNVLSDSFVKKAPCTGKVTEIAEDHIIVTCTNGKKHNIPTDPVHLKSGSGKDTLSIFNKKVKVGQVVKNESILAEGSCMSDGSISLGRTLCTAIMPYKGYNFEDGIVISDSLVKQDKMTSLHGVMEEVTISENDRLMYICKVGESIKKGQPILRKTVGEIEELLGIDEDEEGIETIGDQFIKQSPGGKVVDIEVYSNIEDDHYPLLTSLIKRTRKRKGIKPKERISVGGKTIKGVIVKFKIEQELQIGIGDKLTNRFGAKGVIALVEKETDMPLTPWGDRVEIITNPIGIIGRMNMGQLFELYTGLISKSLAIQFKTLKTKEQVLALLKKVYPKLDGTKNREMSTRFLNNLAKLSPAKFKEFMNQINKSGFVPIIIPPFNAPPYQNISEALKSINLKSGYKLKLPEFNTYTKQEVPVGYMYIQKLEHISELKAHSRATGPITGKTRQPTSGKRREGGQRFGEMDTYALMTYNCPNLLAEIFGPLSDDHATKNEIIAEIVATGGADYRVPKFSPAKDLLNSYMRGLGLEKR